MTFWKLTAGVVLLILAALLTTLICANTTQPTDGSHVVIALLTYTALADLFYVRFLNKVKATA
jgi:hypothetical protein